MALFYYNHLLCVERWPMFLLRDKKMIWQHKTHLLTYYLLLLLHWVAYQLMRTNHLHENDLYNKVMRIFTIDLLVLVVALHSHYTG